MGVTESLPALRATAESVSGSTLGFRLAVELDLGGMTDELANPALRIGGVWQ
jgi:hypothetical protein